MFTRLAKYVDTLIRGFFQVDGWVVASNVTTHSCSLRIRLPNINCHKVPSSGPYLYSGKLLPFQTRKTRGKFLWFQKLPSLRPKRGFCKRLGLCFQHVTKWTKALGPKRRFCRPLGCWCQVKTTLIYCVALCCVSAQQQRPKAWCLQKMLANSFLTFLCHVTFKIR